MSFRFFSGVTFSLLADFPEDAMVSLSTQPKGKDAKRGYHRSASSESWKLAGELGLKSPGQVRVDGSGFSQVFKHGEWQWGDDEHEEKMARVERGLGSGRVDGYFTRDWMCEPEIIAGTDKARAKGYGHIKWGPLGTGLTVEEHQRRTVASGVALEKLNPHRKWIHTIQGYTLEEYFRCIQMYRDAGIDLTQREVVAFGSMCKRQGTSDGPRLAAALIREIPGPRHHVLGFNILGLQALIGMLTPSEQAKLDSDSASWSLKAKTTPILMHGHKHEGPKVKARGYSDADWERLWAGDRFDKQNWPNCANCPIFALHERAHVLKVSQRRWSWQWMPPRGSAVSGVGATLPAPLSEGSMTHDPRKELREFPPVIRRPVQLELWSQPRETGVTLATIQAVGVDVFERDLRGKGGQV